MKTKLRITLSIGAGLVLVAAWLLSLSTFSVPEAQAAVESATFSIVTSDFNIELEPDGAITGTVTAVGGEPMFDFFVEACLLDESACYYAWTDSDGNYSIIPLPADDYRVMVEERDGWKRDYYDDTPYKDEITPVTVNSGESTIGIDFILEPGGTISGWVQDSVGDPIEGIQVAACDYNNDTRCWWAFEQSEGDGSYAIPGMATGQYRVQAYSVIDGYWIAEFYNDTVDYDQATVVSATEGITTTGINFELVERRFIYLPLVMK